LAATAIKGLLERNPAVPAHEIEEVYWGAANQSGEDNRNVARMAALLAGLPVEVSGVTVNRLCASGLEAAVCAYRALAAGEGEIYVAGGVESMSRAPYVMAKPAQAFSRSPEIYDTTLGWRFTNPLLAAAYPPFSMGETAENVAEKYGISRQEQDEFALESQRRYAHEKLAREIIPVAVPQKKGPPTLVERDEHPRPDTTLEKLAALKPVFKKDGTVTAGNSSGINDGAAALLLASESAVKRLNLTPLARIMGAAAAGVDPAYMGIGPVPATQKLVRRLGVKPDIVELNEAFAAQSLACIRLLELDPATVNVNGGAIAIGHPLGCSGARLLATLAHELHARKLRYGLASLCVGVGQGLSVMIERV
jgi:3-oxoadipyl-CoA thiolase